MWSAVKGTVMLIHGGQCCNRCHFAFGGHLESWEWKDFASICKILMECQLWKNLSCVIYNLKIKNLLKNQTSLEQLIKEVLSLLMCVKLLKEDGMAENGSGRM